jgi:iron complex outermembrane receptor protein
MQAHARRRHKFNRFAIWVAFATPVVASSQESKPAAVVLPEITVEAQIQEETATGPVIGYRASRSATATKTDTPLAETPQSVTVVTRDQITDQGATTLQDALTYAAGVRSDAYGLDSRTDSALVRGSEATVYIDGLRQANDYYTSAARPDPYTLERIEVLRGPAAMLYGQGSTGARRWARSGFSSITLSTQARSSCCSAAGPDRPTTPFTSRPDFSSGSI